MDSFQAVGDRCRQLQYLSGLVPIQALQVVGDIWSQGSAALDVHAPSGAGQAPGIWDDSVEPWNRQPAQGVARDEAVGGQLAARDRDEAAATDLDQVAAAH